jgi:hypothetical protein
MTGLRAIMVAVDYADVLAVTLPRNLRHFDEMHIVTDHKSVVGVSEAVLKCDEGRYPKVKWWTTDLFYADGAKFNKWRALEWGLDQMGRRGWLCLMDADVVWPRDLLISEEDGVLTIGDRNGRERPTVLVPGMLCSPYRRMWNEWPLIGGGTKCEAVSLGPPPVVIPVEEEWTRVFARHRNVAEHAGYTQIFHADDPALGPPPWHETDWKHAGGADSLFQSKWPADRKVRPPWEVLHLGPAGHNWFGRATPRADGTVPDGSAERLAAIYDPANGLWARRRAVRAAGGTEADAFRPEKLG